VIIGLHGKMGAGKNEAAKRLALLSKLPVIEVSYAAKLKESAAAVLGCTVEDLERWKNDPDAGVLVNVHGDPYVFQTVRSFLQRYGTEGHRDVFGEDFWLDAALPLYPQGLSSPYRRSLYAVTDVRFQNEADRIRELGGIVVKVVGPTSDTGSHVSERELDCDYSIDNSARDDDFTSLDAQLSWILTTFERQAAA
jgi:hypothetical protein